MAGAAEVAAAILPELGDGQTAWALVPNARGAELATAAGVDHLTITVSASEAYSAKNVHMTVAESLAGLDAIRAAAPAAVLDLVVSFAFGSPFDDEEITPDDVRDDRRAGSRAPASTGSRSPTPPAWRRPAASAPCSTPSAPTSACTSTTPGRPPCSTRGPPSSAASTRFDTAVGGLGGSPFAPAAGGNLATEDLVHLLDDAGIDTGVDLAAVLAIGPRLAELVGHAIPSRVGRRRLGAVNDDRGEILWTPAARRLDGHCGRALRHRARLRRLRRAAPLVGRRPRRVLAGGDGVHRAFAGTTPPRAHARRSTRCPACAGSPAPR